MNDVLSWGDLGDLVSALVWGVVLLLCYGAYEKGELSYYWVFLPLFPALYYNKRIQWMFVGD